MKNTRIDYQYRDGSNYKRGRSEVLAGALSAAEIAEILAKRDEGEFFIPSQVGLEDLQHELWDAYDGGVPTEDDHVWHELADDAFSTTSSSPTVARPTAEYLLAAFRAVDEWDVVGAMGRLGLDTTEATAHALAEIDRMGYRVGADGKLEPK